MWRLGSRRSREPVRGLEATARNEFDDLKRMGAGMSETKIQETSSMNLMVTETTASLKMKCPSCGYELGEFPTPEIHSLRCPKCEYTMTWDSECWDACADKTYPKDFARQWVLWEEGKLGDPNLVYGNDPQYFFRELLEATSLKEQDLRSMRILEIGYGHGRLLQELQKWSPTAYGIDLARPPKSSQLRPGSAIFGNLLAIPFVGGQFDLVICRGVLHHTPDPHQSFLCVADQVADNGILYLAGLYEPGKRRLYLRTILARSWSYPEPVSLAIASAFGIVKATIQAAKTLSLKKFNHTYGEYKLAYFDLLAPRWQSTHSKEQITGWCESKGFAVRRIAYGDYVAKKSGPGTGA